MPDGLLTQGGLSMSLKQRLQNALGPIVLRPLAARVRSIWPYSRWVLREAMKSSSLISLLGRPLPQYWRLVRPRYSLMFLPRHGESTIGEFLTQSRLEQKQSSPFISMERMPETSGNSDFR